MTRTFDIQRGNFIQILNVYGSHWITVANGCSSGSVNVYDSLPNCALYSHTKKQLASILCSKDKKISVNFIDVQTQSSGNDCGLFSIAFAASLCAGEPEFLASISLIFYLACVGENPSELHYIQHDFRNHLFKCLEANLVTPFPRRNRKRKGGNRGQTSFGIFCTCRLPAYGKMISCSSCHEWFHRKCVVTPTEVWRRKEVDWYCNSCIK